MDLKQRRKKRIKYLLFSFVVSLPFWMTMNALGSTLDDFFFLKETGITPDHFAAQVSIQMQRQDRLEDMKPVLRKDAEELELNAESALSLYIDKYGKQRILFEKNIDQRMPIASLTKLMTAKVVLDNYDLSKIVTVSKESVDQEENFGQLVAGKQFKAEYLLYPLLIESSNDAAYCLADDYDEMTESKFLSLMNQEAARLGMNDSYFVNTNGLDPEDDEPKSKMNYSTAENMAELAKALLKEPLIWKILSTKEYNGEGPELVNTNDLLFDISFAENNKILGGKTGYTEFAGQCMILVLEKTKNNGYLINVILNTNSRFTEMKKLTNWLNTAYIW